MQSTDQPSKVSVPFADTGLKRAIPNTSQIGVLDGAASFPDGFPPKCFLPLAAGGVPPAGKDFNGLLNIITLIQKWQSAGGLFKYDAAFAAAVGGYPKGAVLLNATSTYLWINRADGNTTDPDSVGAASWESFAGACTFDQSRTYASASIAAKLKRIVCVTDGPWNADATGATASDAAFAAAVAYVIAGGAGGRVWAPAGTYLFNGGAAAPDGFKTGVQLPDTGTDFTTAHGVEIVGDGVGTRFKAGSNNMIIVRGSRLFSGVRNVLLDANGHTGVWAGALVPADMTQTTSLVSHSFQTWDVFVEGCDEGIVVQPGPSVAGSDSGCFYQNVRAVVNNTKRAVWTKQDVTGHGNRITRSVFNIIPMRGNTGVQIDYGTELEVNVWAELLNTGATPNATPVAVLISNNNTANIRVRGYAESCSRGLVTLNPQAVDRSGWHESVAPDASGASTTQFNVNLAVIGRNPGQLAQLAFDNPSFVSLRADPNQTNSKTLSIFANDVERERWDADGSKTTFGTLGNVGIDSSGSRIAFSYNGTNSIDALGASASLAYRSNLHSWNTGAGVQIVTLNSTQFVPRVDNATSFGVTGLRWSAIWSATGTIQTSDPDTKTDVVESPLGLDFILKLKPVAYRYKVGGQQVIGAREVAAVLDEQGLEIEPAKVEPVIEQVAGKRLHYGFLTSDVKAALDACGGVDFAGYVKANLNDPNSEEGLRYTYFIAPMALAMQQMHDRFTARIDALEAALEARLAALEPK